MKTILFSMNTAGIIVIIALAVLLVVFALTCVHIVPQANAFVIEWLGKYSETWRTGLHIKVPFFQKIARRVPLMEQVADFQPQSVITKDNPIIVNRNIINF